MVAEMTSEETALFDEISSHALSLWEKSVGIEGRTTDPKIFSAMLFKRLWSNHRGFTLLWKNGFYLEADIVLRSGIETSICVAANEVMQDEFVELMRGDACATLKGQIKMQRDAGDNEMAGATEAVLRDMLAKRPEDYKPARLNWKELPDTAGIPVLYSWHRMLSGLSSHVTGASILRGIEFVDGPGPRDLSSIDPKLALMMMGGATLGGTERHAKMIGDEDERKNAAELFSKLTEFTKEARGAVTK